MGSLEYILGNRVSVTYQYNDFVHRYFATDFTDYVREFRRIMTADFYSLGLITAKDGKTYVFNGPNISTVSRSGKDIQVVTKFRNEIVVNCVSEDIAAAHVRYLLFVRDCNNLEEVRRNRRVCLINAGVNQGQIYPSLAEYAASGMRSGDYVIVMPDTYSISTEIDLANGVDIELPSGVQFNIDAVANNMEYLFSDTSNGATTNRIFGRGIVNYTAINTNQFCPVIRAYQNSDMFAELSECKQTTLGGDNAVLYSRYGRQTARIRTITDMPRLIDNDNQCECQDLDCLTATGINLTFFPGINDQETSINIIRNGTITGNDRAIAIDTIAQGVMTYHYIHAIETADNMFLDTFGQAGNIFETHHSIFNCSEFSSGTFAHTWRNNQHRNFAGSLDGTTAWTIYESENILTN